MHLNSLIRTLLISMLEGSTLRLHLYIKIHGFLLISRVCDIPVVGTDKILQRILHLLKREVLLLRILQDLIQIIHSFVQMVNQILLFIILILNLNLVWIMILFPFLWLSKCAISAVLMVFFIIIWYLINWFGL